MKRLSSVILIVLFCLFLALLSLACLFTPDRAFSEQENRYLQQAPAFSLSSLFSGHFTEEFSDYCSDQFVLRDSWISLKSRFERLLGKTENNGVYFCANDTLITRFDEPDEKLLAANIAAVNALAESCEGKVTLSLIPGAVSIWADRLPPNAPNCDQQALIERIYAQTNARTVDNVSALAAHSGEYIFYRTDHHWTTLGAYYGYCALAESMGFAPLPLASFTPETVTDAFYGTVYSSSGVRWVSPDSMQIFVPSEGVTVTNYSDGAAHEGLVYDREKLSLKDKYSLFFGGNTPLLDIETPAADKPSLLVVRDSYSDCELPFLFAHFSRIAVVDLRYYKLSLAEYLAENEFDAVLLNFSVANFCSDNNLFLLSR